MAHIDDQHRTGPSFPPSPSPHLPFPELHGHGLRLRAWDAESDVDVESWLRGCTDPEFRRWNTPLIPVTDADSARASLLSKAAQAEDGSMATYCVTDAGTGVPLGQIGVNAIHEVLGRARIGYWVLPEARGQGVATRALALVTHWGHTDLGLHRLELDHAVGHDASCRVAERCGYRYEGTLRGSMFEAGRQDAFRDAHVHGRLATDPLPSP
ncbi:GNAT family N-acetyltransferase [Streptomyces sp. NPDC001658]